MTTKFFYSALISFQSLKSDLDQLKLTKEDKQELLQIAHSHLHHNVIDTILSQLKQKDKEKFLELLTLGQDKKIWAHLNSKAEKIEDKITQTAKQLEKELREDIRKLK